MPKDRSTTATPTSNWTMNRTGLERGMHIRRPGLKESLEVLEVKSGQAKVKLPDGQTSTISAMSEVEYRWPNKEKTAETPKAVQTAPKPTPQPVAEMLEEFDTDTDTDTGDDTDTDEDNTAADNNTEWTSNWSLLDRGQTIEIIGEPDTTFTVLRVTDSTARLKNNSNGNIVPMSVGHKFKVLKEEGRKEPVTPFIVEPEPEPSPVATPNAGSRSRGKLEEDDSPTSFDEDEKDDIETGTEIEYDTDNVPADIQAEIDAEFGDDDDDADDLENYPLPEDTLVHDRRKEKALPADRSTPSGSTTANVKNTVRPPKDPDWMTVQQLSEQSGHSIVKINNLRKGKEISSNRYKPDPDDGRRFLYHISLVDKLKALPEGKGGGARKTSTSRASSRARKSAGTATWKPDDEAPVEATQPALRPRATATVTTYANGIGSTLDAQLSATIEHAQAQLSGLQELIDTLEAQRERLRTWS